MIIQEVGILLSDVDIKYHFCFWTCSTVTKNRHGHNPSFASHKVNPPWSSPEIFLTWLLTFAWMRNVKTLKWCWLSCKTAKTLSPIQPGNAWPTYGVHVLSVLCSQRTADRNRVNTANLQYMLTATMRRNWHIGCYIWFSILQYNNADWLQLGASEKVNFLNHFW